MSPTPTDQLQGPFPLPGGGSGYILPAQPAPAPSGQTSDAADAVSAALSSVLPPGPFSSFPGAELNGVVAQPPDVSADVSPFENAEFVNDEGLYVWQKPALPVATFDFHCYTGVNSRHENALYSTYTDLQEFETPVRKDLALVMREVIATARQKR